MPAHRVFPEGRAERGNPYGPLAGALGCSFAFHALAALYLPGWPLHSAAARQEASVLQLLSIEEARPEPAGITRERREPPQPERPRSMPRSLRPALPPIPAPAAWTPLPSASATATAAVARPIPDTAAPLQPLAAPSDAADTPARAGSAGASTVQVMMYASTPAAESAGTPPAGVASEDDHHGGHADVAYLYNPQPDYPSAARRLHLEGSVVLRVLVDQTGSPGEIRIKHSSGVAPLDDAALTKVRTWRFTPAMEGSAAIAHWVDIPIRFRLED